MLSRRKAIATASTTFLTSMAGCVKTSSEREVRTTFIGPKREPGTINPLQTGAKAKPVRVIRHKVNYLFGRDESSLRVEIPNEIDIDKGYAHQVLLIDEALGRRGLRYAPIERQFTYREKRPSIYDIYSRWFDSAEQVLSEGDPIVGVSKVLTHQLTNLNEAAAQVISDTRKSLEESLPPDILRLIQSLIRILKKTDEGQSINNLIEAIKDVNKNLLTILELVPNVYKSSETFLNGTEHTPGIPIFIDLLGISKGQKLDYRYIAEYAFHVGPNKQVSISGKNKPGVLGLMHNFSSNIRSLYESFVSLADSIKRLSKAINNLPANTGTTLAKLTTMLRALATLMEAGAKVANDQYLWEVDWCTRNISEVYVSAGVY